MSRFGMGFGKDGDRTVDTRPCVRVHSSRCQVVLNKWFGGPKEDKPHPDWMSTQFEAPARTFAGDQGDWEMVWHPRSRPNTVTVPTRKVMHTLKDEEEKVKLKARLAHELANTDFSTIKQPTMEREGTEAVNKSRVCSSRA
eukprot:CAMPEP_0179479844 /NCGR_PEP_ID=MMETSP0799-20121207/57991_1 /TAXON_ID=46947 /ORGANISM="Geminigera cryophila, Strain CCMP2564" /LENGTH=140 /DNA_ID=CAMNT_0021291695 /DNA_START=30 /DNA_END=448 /DNA_ORIENTATION=+